MRQNARQVRYSVRVLRCSLRLSEAYEMGEVLPYLAPSPAPYAESFVALQTDTAPLQVTCSKPQAAWRNQLSLQTQMTTPLGTLKQPICQSRALT